MNLIRIPVAFGKNRVRGDSIGPMVDDAFGEDNLGKLRAVLRHEASRSEVITADIDQWVTRSVRQLLNLYEAAHVEWSSKKDGTIGLVFEANLPSGSKLLMGDRRVLKRGASCN